MSIGGHDLEFPQYTHNELLSIIAEIRRKQGQRDGINHAALEVAELLVSGDVKGAKARAMWGLEFLHPEWSRGGKVCRYLVNALKRAEA